jgi:chromosomal replication initiation ATPase DnaA
VAVYLARKKCGLRLEEIGREFGIEKYSSVSSIVTKTERKKGSGLCLTFVFFFNREK